MTAFRTKFWHAFGDLLDISPGKRSDDSEFRRKLREIRTQRLSDYEMVMSDLRRVMIRELDTIPQDERTQLSERLQPDFRFDFERRLGLGEEPAGDDPAQFKLAFAD